MTHEGVEIEFGPSRRYSPDELQMLARWLFALRHETIALAASGSISEENAFDTVRNKVVGRAADNKV